MDENENPIGTESGISDNPKLDELDKHFREMELFNLLLRQQPNAENINEDGAENPAENIYMFDVVRQEAGAKDYGENDFSSQIIEFCNLGYVDLLSDDTEADPEQLIRDKEYSKVQICLNREKLLQVLLDDSLSAIRTMRDLVARIQKQESVWAFYDKSREEFQKQYQEVKNWHDEFASMGASLEIMMKEDKEDRNLEAERLKIDVKKIVMENVDSRLEDELKAKGKIGSAMQDMQKDIIQFMGIFIAIFALLGLNVSNVEKWSTADFFHINLVITASMATLLFFISVIMNGRKDSRTSCMGILTALLWGLAAFVFLMFPYLKDEVLSFWATYNS